MVTKATARNPSEARADERGAGEFRALTSLDDAAGDATVDTTDETARRREDGLWATANDRFHDRLPFKLVNLKA